MLAWVSPPAFAQTGGNADVQIGYVPRQVRESVAVSAGPLDRKQMLRLGFALQVPRLAEEEQFLLELQTKGSPNFRHFLTAEEWNARFAPSANQEQEVVEWARAQGLVVTQRYPNRLLVDVEAPVETIERALNVSVNLYQLGARTYFSNDRTPSLPARLSQVVQSVVGLNNFEALAPRQRGARPVNTPIYLPGPVRADGGSGGGDGDPAKRPQHYDVIPPPNPSYLHPQDIWNSNTYNFGALHRLSNCCNPSNNPVESPPETSIAIATAGVFLESDIDGFARIYGLASNYHTVYIDGTPNCNIPDACLETTMDLEWATAMANSFGAQANTATVWVYEGANANSLTFADIYNHILTESHARVLTTSWGGPEGEGLAFWFFGQQEGAGFSPGVMSTIHLIFNQMTGEGWTIVAAAGDHGATDDCAFVSVGYPASDPDVLAAGGTTLQLWGDRSYQGEVAWTGANEPPGRILSDGSVFPGSCQNNNGGGGGGFSIFWQWPASFPYQLASVTPRTLPDFSLNAGDRAANPAGIPQNVLYYGNWVPGGGTSIVAPELAGFFAQENSYLRSICDSGTPGCTPMVGNVNPYVYAEGVYGANGPNPLAAPHYPFYDITSGYTSNNIANPGWQAVPGYDLATGWGSANMLQLAWALNWFALGDNNSNWTQTVGFSTSGAPHQWYTFDLSINLHAAPTGSGGPALGLAGFSWSWDQPVANPYSEPTPGGSAPQAPNPFYDGPRALSNSTSLLLSDAGQGCHTLHFIAWDNAGATSPDQTAGPYCYDPVPPITTAAVTPHPNVHGWNNTAVQVTLSATDAGSGVAATYFAVDNPACTPIVFLGYKIAVPLSQCTLFAAPLNLTAEGQHTVYYFSEDVAGSIETPPAPLPVNIDRTPPVTSAFLSGSQTFQVTLTATDNLSGVAQTSYWIDGGSVQLYSAPFSVPGTGSHVLQFRSVDAAGNLEATQTVPFPQAPAVPVLISPANGATGIPTTLSLAWNAASQAASYDVYFGASLTPPFVANTAATSFNPGALNAFTTYHWRIVARSSAGTAASAVYSFNTSVVPSITVTSSANPSRYGAPVTLTAAVSPSSVTGKVEFLAGVTPLGAAAIDGSGVARLSTIQLPVGEQSLRALYGGLAGAWPPSQSSAVPQLVKAAPAAGFAGAMTTTAAGLYLLGTGDFDGDGIADLVYGNSQTNELDVARGVGDGTFAPPALAYSFGAAVYLGAAVVGDFNGDGYPDLAVFNLGAINILLNRGNATFSSAAPPFAGNGAFPTAIATADFNGDGYADLAVSGSGDGLGTVSIFFGNGDGTFQSAILYQANAPVSIAVGDFNGDGWPDLVTGGAGGTLNVLLNAGSGVFQTAVPYSANTGLNGQNLVAVGDFNGDGWPDLAVTENAGDVLVLINTADGAGQFRPATAYPAGSFATQPVVADVNGDGKLDVVVSSPGGISVLYGKGDGSLQSVQSFPNAAASIGEYVVGDFNGDGRTDIAWAYTYVNFGTGKSYYGTYLGLAPPPALSIALTHTGNFTTGQKGATYTVTVSNSLLATATSGPVTVTEVRPADLSILLMSGDGWNCSAFGTKCSRSDALAPGASYPAITVSVSVAITAPASVVNQATVTGGGSADAGASDTTTIVPVPVQPSLSSPANGTTGVSLGTSLTWSAATNAISYDVYFGLSPTPPFLTNTTSTTYTPGLLDAGATYYWQIVARNPNATTPSLTYSFQTIGRPVISLVPSVNPSQYGQVVLLTATVSPSTITGVVEFLDGATIVGSGKIDASGAALCSTILLPAGTRLLRAIYPGQPGVWLPGKSNLVLQTVNPVAGTGFAPPANLPGLTKPLALAVGDFNGDGKADLVVANGNSTVGILLGNGNGTFQPALNASAGSAQTFVAVGDFNGDGRADLALALGSANSLAILLGNGDGTFQAPATYPVGGNPISLAVADFNGDGIADLAVANYDTNNLSLLLGKGDGSFLPAVPYATGANPRSVVTADFNGDGLVDVAVANYGSGNFSLLLGNGDGTLQPAANYPAGTQPTAIAVADFNLDGNPDVVVANRLAHLFLSVDSSDSVSVLLGRGDGGFQAPASYPVGLAPTSLTVADFNGDGYPDLVAADANTAAVSVLLGGIHGTLQPAANYVAGQTSGAVAVADFNGDGRADIAVANQGDDNVSILLGLALSPSLSISKTHTGTFAAGQSGFYTLTVTNSATAAPTSGAVTVSEAPPARMSVALLAGQGWNCPVGGTTCTRSDPLAPGASYPAITAGVNIAGSAGSPLVNGAIVAGGSSASAIARDSTNIQMEQTIVFPPPSNVPFGAVPFALSATATSGLPVAFASQSNAVCTVSSATLSLVASGTCVIQATQPGNANYQAATPVTQTFQVTPGAQSISFTSLPDKAGGLAFTLNVTATSSLPVVFASTTPSVCTVTASTVTLVGLGLCTIQASQPGNANYSAAPVVTQSFQVLAEFLGTSSFTAGSGAGNGSVEIGFQPYTSPTPWTAASQASWLHLLSGSSAGAGAATLLFAFDANPGSAIRSGSILFGSGLSLTVTQAGASHLPVAPVTVLVSSGLTQPLGVAVDSSGNVYIADAPSNAVRKWTAATQQLSTLVSTGLSYPSGVAVDSAGNVYIADYGNSAVRKWNAATQQVTTLVSTALNHPTGVAVDGSGNVYIADTGNSAIKLWSASTQQVATLVSAALASPRAVAVDVSGNVYIADTNNNAIRKWSPLTSQLTTLVPAGVSSPSGVAVDGAGNVYIADSGNGAIKVWNASTQQVATLATSGLAYPYQLAVDSSGKIYAGQTGANAVEAIPVAFAGPAALTESAAAGSDALLPVLPATTALTGVFAPLSDQNWLVIGTNSNGVVHFSFTANTGTAARTAHITILGQQVTVTQNGPAPQTIAFATIPTQFLGAAPFSLTATASSGLAVSFASTTPAVCTVVGATVTIVAIGACGIQATQSGSAGYLAATPVTQSFLVTTTCDVFRNGTISVADVKWILNQALGVTPIVNDLDGDGLVNVFEVQIELNAAMERGCNAK